MISSCLREDLEAFSLHMVEADGEVDFEFPPLGNMEPISQFDFSHLGLVQKDTPMIQKPKTSVIVTVWVKYCIVDIPLQIEILTENFGKGHAYVTSLIDRHSSFGATCKIISKTIIYHCEFCFLCIYCWLMVPILRFKADPCNAFSVFIWIVTVFYTMQLVYIQDFLRMARNRRFAVKLSENRHLIHTSGDKQSKLKWRIYWHVYLQMKKVCQLRW